MLTFTNTTVKKPQLIKAIKAHAKLDAFIQGTYEKENGIFRGCAVGCTLQSFGVPAGQRDQHKRYEDLFGIPQSFARLEDRIFERLSVEEAKKWPLRFSKAIPVGKDLMPVMNQFGIRLLEECLTYDRAKYPEIDKGVHQVIQALKGEGDLVAARQSMWKVRRAAYAAADAAAYAAAAYAYAYAADADAYAAAYAAADDAADAAAAAYAAYAAAAYAAAAYAADAADDAADAAAAYAAAYAAADAAAAARQEMWLKISNILVEELEKAA